MRVLHEDDGTEVQELLSRSHLRVDVGVVRVVVRRLEGPDDCLGGAQIARQRRRRGQLCCCCWKIQRG